MRRWFLLLLAGSVLLGAASFSYRVLGRDYRYFQLVKLGDELLKERLPFPGQPNLRLCHGDQAQRSDRLHQKSRSGASAKAIYRLPSPISSTRRNCPQTSVSSRYGSQNFTTRSRNSMRQARNTRELSSSIRPKRMYCTSSRSCVFAAGAKRKHSAP